MPGRLYGAVARYDDVTSFLKACAKVRDAGYTKWDSLSPFPVHGVEKAMGLKPSPLPWFVLGAALTGGSAAMFFQYWTSAVDYPLVISGKPLFSWPAFVPVTFEITVLLSALTAFFAMLVLNGLPRHHHPLFAAEGFERVTDDQFFIAVEAADPKFDADAVRAFLQSTGALNVELLEEPA